MIASPGDVVEIRNISRDIIHEWNYIHSLKTGAILTPVGWDTHLPPTLAGRPQGIINDRLLKNCDILVAIFWTRLGTPTGKSDSGTTEEIQEHISAGKPAMVYFCTAPVAPNVNTEQFGAVQQFRKWCEQKGLVQEYDNITDFRDKFSKHLAITLNTDPYVVDQLKLSFEQADTASLSVNTTPAKFKSIDGEELSEEAIQLLLEAGSDERGIIMKLSTLGGDYIQANGKTFGDSRDHRSVARWKYALDQLVYGNYVQGIGYKGEVFEVTAQGYDAIDAIKALNKALEQ